MTKGVFVSSDTQGIRMAKFVTFGETMFVFNAKYVGPLDETLDGPYEVYCAGAESSVCLDLERLQVPDLETVWISKLGLDKEGETILETVRHRTTAIAPRVEGLRSGIAYINHLENGEIAKAYRRKGSAASQVTFDEVEPHLAGADILHVTGITPALSDTARTTIFQSLEYAQKNDIPVSFDANYRAPIWKPDEARSVFDDMIPYSWLFKVGHDEAETVWGLGLSPEEYVRRFQRTNGRLVVVTRDAAGATAYDGANMVEHDGYAIDFVDPVGAGDAFIAGFLSEILRRGTVRDFFALDHRARKDVLTDGLRIANVCGALLCTSSGDTEPMPTADEVTAFLDVHTNEMTRSKGIG